MVIKAERAPRAATIGTLLHPLGIVTLLTNEQHLARQLADQQLREAKEKQRDGVATGAETMPVVKHLLELRGKGGSERKSFWAPGRNLCVLVCCCKADHSPLGSFCGISQLIRRRAERHSNL